MRFLNAALLLAAPAAYAADPTLNTAGGEVVTWVRGGDVCGGGTIYARIFVGIDKDITKCAGVGFGFKPAEYLSFRPTAFSGIKVDNSAYLTTTANVLGIDPYYKKLAANEVPTQWLLPALSSMFSPIVSTSAGNEALGLGKGVYLGQQAGLIMGNPGTDTSASGDKWGFIGTASYIMVSGTISTNSNIFGVAAWASAAGVGTFATAISPLVCVGDYSGTGAYDKANCGAKKTYQVGEFKYSLFGYTAGGGFKKWVTDSEIKYFSVRNTVDVSTMGTGVKIALNDGALDTVANALSEPVTGLTKMQIKGTNSNLLVTFPQKYNAGKFEGIPLPGVEVTPGTGVMTFTKLLTMKTQNVAINVQKSTVTDEFYVDFLFAVNTGELDEKDTYFVYDPAVTDADNPVGAGASASGAYSVGASLAVVLAFIMNALV